MKKAIILISITLTLLTSGTVNLTNIRYFYEVETGAYNESSTEYMLNPVTGERTKLNK